jgi:hypothetical protein
VRWTARRHALHSTAGSHRLSTARRLSANHCGIVRDGRRPRSTARRSRSRWGKPSRSRLRCLIVVDTPAMSPSVQGRGGCQGARMSARQRQNGLGRDAPFDVVARRGIDQPVRQRRGGLGRSASREHRAPVLVEPIGAPPRSDTGAAGCPVGRADRALAARPPSGGPNAELLGPLRPIPGGGSH